MTVPRSEWPVVVRDFYRTYLRDALHHLRFTQSARSLPSEDELLEILGRGFVAVHEHAANLPESRGGLTRRNRMLR